MFITKKNLERLLSEERYKTIRESDDRHHRMREQERQYDENRKLRSKIYNLENRVTALERKLQEFKDADVLKNLRNNQ